MWKCYKGKDGVYSFDIDKNAGVIKLWINDEYVKEKKIECANVKVDMKAMVDDEELWKLIDKY